MSNPIVADNKPIAVKLKRGKEHYFCTCGLSGSQPFCDGFGQYLGEFTTAVKYGMNITHILLNNGELGKISKEQRAGNWQVWQTSLHNPD